MTIACGKSVVDMLRRRVWVVAVAGVCLAGCSGNSFLARRFDNFTAHYNKFYNANRTFREQERKLQKGDPKIDRDRYLDIFELPKQQGRSAEFEKVITKCADLLRNHPRSKWVDDALMLIGKSYFYQSNVVGAEQKFNEVINLNGPLKDEAEFWLARTLVAGQSTSGAEEIIGTALAQEEMGKEWRSLFLLLRGDLRTEVGDWPSAIDDISAGLEHVKDGDTAARAYFLLGQLYETDAQYEKAVDAYHQVQSKKPLYELSYAAMLNEIRVKGLKVDPEAALKDLDRMMRDNKHFQNRNQLQELHARILAAAGDPEAARDNFLDQLYPPDPSRKTSLRGEVHYRLAELYRDYLGDFYSAGIHFDTASSVLRTPQVQNEQLAPDAIEDAKNAASTFKDYRETLDRVTRMDSLLYLGSLDQAAFDSAVAVVRIQLAEEAERIQEELERRKTQSRFRQAASDANPRTGTTPTTTTSADAGSAGTYGFLNFKNLQRVQEAFLNFKEVWGDRPLVPGWRREEAIVLAQRAAAENGAKDGKDAEQKAQVEQVRFLPPVNIDEVPRDSASQAAMRLDRAETRYRLANVLFLSIGLPDSAAKWYRLVIDEDSEEPVAQRALYAMAEVHEALGDKDAAKRTLERVIDLYPKSSYADKARSRLGLPPQHAAAVTDTLELATARYEEAYDLWVQGDYEKAIDAMVRTAADFSKFDVAAKALLAVGRIYLEKAHADGSDFYGVISIGDSVFSTAEIEEGLAAAAATVQPVAEVDTASAGSGAEGEAAQTETTASAAPGQIQVAAADTTGAGLGEADSLRANATQVAAQEVSKAVTTPAPAPDAAEPVAEDKAGERRPTPKKSDALAVRDDAARPVGDEERLRPTADKIGKKAEDDLADRPVKVRRELEDEIAPQVSTPDTSNTGLKRPKEGVEPTGQEPGNGQLATAADSMGQTVDSLAAAAAAQAAEVGAPPHNSDASKPKTKAPPPKAPEITWQEPEYFVDGLIPVPMTLHSLYGAVATNFGSTPYGKRAVALRNGLVAARTALAVVERQSESAVDVATSEEASDEPPATGEIGPGENDDETLVLEPVTPDSSKAYRPDSDLRPPPPGKP
ncbi:MAG: tetratricopeptide repeat protein [Rhodothermales bacterium]